MEYKKRIKEIIIIYVIPFLIIMLLSLYFIKYAGNLKILGDEYGYWSAGDYLSGRSVWKEFSSWSAYYGFGYGIILGLLLLLPFPTSFLYKLAVSINGLLLFGIYCMIFQILYSNRNMVKKNVVTQVVCSLVIAFMTSNLYYTQFTMSEVLLSFCYWFLIFSLWNFCRTQKMQFIYLCILTSAYLFTVHLRTIGIIIVTIIGGFFLLHKKRIGISSVWRLLLLISLMMLGIFIIRRGYLNYLTPSVHYNTVSVYDGNNFSGQTGKIYHFFTIEGFADFCINFCGKMFYAFSGTFLMVWTGIAMCLLLIKNTIQKKSKKVNAESFMCVFATLSMFITIAISSLYLSGAKDSRMDILTYGRYFEFTIGPVVLFGLISLKEIDKKRQLGNMVISGIGLYLLISIITNHYQNYNSASSHFALHCAFMHRWFMEFQFSQDTILNIALLEIVGVFLYTVLYTIFRKKNNIALYGMLVVFSYYIYTGFYTYSYGIIPWYERQSKKEEQLYEYVIENNIENDIYCDISDVNIYSAEHLQFLMKDNSLHVVENKNMFIQQYPTKYFLTSIYVNQEEMNTLGFELVYLTEKVMMWVYNN